MLGAPEGGIFPRDPRPLEVRGMVPDPSSAIDDADEERGEAIAHVFRVYLDDFGIGGVAEALEEFPDGYFMLDVPPATFPCCFFVFCTREFREERIFFE